MTTSPAVAEEAGVIIGIHPDDPRGGIGRHPALYLLLFRRLPAGAGDCRQPELGVCLCVGCWLEGGERMGKDVLETIRYYGERRKLFKFISATWTPLAPLRGDVPEWRVHGHVSGDEDAAGGPVQRVVIPDHIPRWRTTPAWGPRTPSATCRRSCTARRRGESDFCCRWDEVSLAQGFQDTVVEFALVEAGGSMQEKMPSWRTEAAARSLASPLPTPRGRVWPCHRTTRLAVAAL